MILKEFEVDEQIITSQQDKDWWAALEEEIEAEKMAGGEGRLIPPPEYKISRGEWTGDEDGVNNEHYLLYDSDMRSY
jgi:hypothetical protein